MKKNKIFFQDGEANAWFMRNKEQIENSGADQGTDLLISWLKPFQNQITKILEIGCGSGHRIEQLSHSLSASGYGVEPSRAAVDYIHSKFPDLQAKVGFGDDVPFAQKFDLVHLGFFLYLVDREFYLRCISEADRLTRLGGFLSIIDFETPFLYSNEYSHLEGINCYKQNNSDVFVSSGLYTIVNKYQFSHENFFFNKNVDQRVSLTLLYKETSPYKTT